MGPTFIKIDHAKLRHNLQLIRNRRSGKKIMAVVKADAYGHGALSVARTFEAMQVDFLAVAFPEEAHQIRDAGIKTPILLLGAQLPHFFEALIPKDISLTITALSQLSELEKSAKTCNTIAKVHLKFDSGMNRVGFYEAEFAQAIQHVQNSPYLKLEGVYSHLSSADEADTTYTELQIKRFTHIYNSYKPVVEKETLFHLSNSAAIMHYPQAVFDMLRPGVMLYGNPPAVEFETDWPLQEVMSWHTQVALVKKVAMNEPLSYSRRYRTTQNTHVALLPVGYADGYNRKLTNVGQVLIGGKRYTLSGTVCMDQVTVDIGPHTQIKAGDEVVLLGSQNGKQIKNIEMASWLETIPYEITCYPSKRVKRLDINNG